MLKSTIIAVVLTVFPTVALAQSSNWQEIATVQGGASLQVRTDNVRTRQLPGRDPEVIFQARLQYDNSRDDGTYAANCTNPDLWQLSDYQYSQDIQIPLYQGTIAEVLWVWACN